jgi:hypothetical protein
MESDPDPIWRGNLHAAATFIGRVTQFATPAITPTTSITGQTAA